MQNVTAATSGPVDTATLRLFAGHFVTGVAVITTVDDAGRPYGMTANAVTSLSLDPPLYAVCVGLTAETLPVLRASGRFTVNLLKSDQERVSRQFAGKGGPEKFAPLRHSPGHNGAPVIEGVLAVAECDITDELSGGDHVILVGLVRQARVSAGEPLVFYRGGYAELTGP